MSPFYQLWCGISEGSEVVKGWRWRRMTLTCDVWLQNTGGSVCEVWCSSSSVGFLPALYRRTKRALLRCVCVLVSTHTNTNLTMLRAPSKNLSHRHTRIRRTGTLSSVMAWQHLDCYCFCVSESQVSWYGRWKHPGLSSSGDQNEDGLLWWSSRRTQRGHGWAFCRHSVWNTAPQPSHLLVALSWKG